MYYLVNSGWMLREITPTAAAAAAAKSKQQCSAAESTPGCSSRLYWRSLRYRGTLSTDYLVARKMVPCVALLPDCCIHDEENATHLFMVAMASCLEGSRCSYYVLSVRFVIVGIELLLEESCCCCCCCPISRRRAPNR